MFRKEALVHKKIKWRGRALLIQGMPAWLTAVLCLFFIIAFITFISVGTYTRRITVNGEISIYPRASNVYSTVQGVIIEKYVSEGQIVKPGQPFYLIDVSRSTRSGVISENQRKDINNQLTRISQIISKLESSKRATLDMLEKQKTQYSLAYSRSSEILRQAKDGIELMKKNMDNYRSYQKKGLVNKDQLTNQIALYYQQQNNFLGLSTQNEQNALQITSLESQLHTQAAEFDNQIYQMELQRYELKKELLNIDAGEKIIVRALADGVVDSLSVSVGQMVNVGDSLLQVLPQKIDYYSLVIWVPNSIIPYISVGDMINVRYDAFPVEQFGQFSGVITVISKTPASSQEMQTYQSAPKDTQHVSETYYKVIVKPSKQTIQYNGKNLNLENGMKAQSTLFLEKRKIYQWMISPFYDMKISVTGPVHE